MNLKSLKIKPLILSLSLFHAAIAAISWFIFYLSSKNPELIYHSLKSYFIPVDFSTKLAKANWIWLMDNPAWHISFKQLKINSGLKIFQELIHWFIILVDLLFIYLIFNPKRLSDKSISSLSFKEVLVYAAIFSLVGVFSIPNDSSDIYGYIARGAQQVFYDFNPYQSVVADINNWQGQAFFGNILWENNPAPYGPLFIFLCKLIVTISFKNIWLAIFLFKLLSSACLLGTLFFTYKIFNLENLHNRAKLFNIFEPSSILPFIALNPFLFYHCSWNGHNDIVMVFFFMASIYALFKKRFNLSFVLITAAILIKYIVLVLLPLIVIYIWKDFYFIDKVSRIPLSLRNLVKYLVPFGLIVSLLMAALLLNHYDFFSADFGEINNNVTLSHKSLFNSLETIYKAIAGRELPVVVKYSFLAAFSLFAAFIYLKFWKGNFSKESELSMEYYDDRYRSLNDAFLNSATYILASLVLIASPKFHSWYLVIVLALAFLTYPEFALVLSISHMLSFTFVDQANILNYILMTLLPSSVYFLRGRRPVT